MPQLPDFVMVQLPQIVDGLRVAKYLGAAGITVMLYDWLLTLPEEVAHIWTTDGWSVPSVFFLVVRFQVNQDR